MIRGLLFSPLLTEEQCQGKVADRDLRSVEQFVSQSRRRERLTWRAMLYEFLGEQVEIEYLDGAPIVVDRDIHIGVSHTTDMVAVVVADNPCAVDIERKDRDVSRIIFIKSRACFSVSVEALPPLKRCKIGSRKVSITTINTNPSTKLSITAFASVFSAACILPSPRRIDILAAAPTPTIAPKAPAMFIIGIVIAIPAIAAPPTPCPTNIESIIWYSEFDAIAIIAGAAYRQSSEPILSVPKESVFACFAIISNQHRRQYALPSALSSSPHCHLGCHTL